MDWDPQAGNGARVSLERIASGFSFTEGPVWDAVHRRLIFSDIPKSVVYTWDPRRETTIFRTPSNKTNGQALDGDGRLIRCEHATSRLVRDEEDGSVTVLASHYGCAELNSPNDVVCARDGSVWFTDPPYGRMDDRVGITRPVTQVPSVYRLDLKTNELTRMATDFEACNGLCFSPSEDFLYVNDSERRTVMRCEVTGDGLGQREIIAQFAGHGGPPDGMKVDETGMVYCSGPEGIHVLTSDGDPVDVLPIPEVVGNLAWGDEDFHTLYIMGSTSVYRCRTAAAGAR